MEVSSTERAVNNNIHNLNQKRGFYIGGGQPFFVLFRSIFFIEKTKKQKTKKTKNIDLAPIYSGEILYDIDIVIVSFVYFDKYLIKTKLIGIIDLRTRPNF